MRKFTKQHREKLSEAHKGKIPWNKGLVGFKQSEETKRKRSLSLMGHPVSKKTREKISKSQKGEKSVHWKGGRKNKVKKYGFHSTFCIIFSFFSARSIYK